MMPPDDLVPIQFSASNKDDKYKSSSDSQKTMVVRPAAEAQRCPRCDSSNTKFCYYNNYNLSQPRYFCKTCRRYWTKGGALRNIPVGGGSRKNKKIYSKSSPSSSRFSSDFLGLAGSGSYLNHIGGFKFSNIGLSSGMNFHTFDGNFPKTISRVQHYQQLSTTTPFGYISRSLPSTYSSLHNLFGNSSGTLTGFNFVSPLSTGIKQDHGNVVFQDDERNITSNDIVASSIESLSSINQDLHWKLQQQRLMFDGENNMMDASSTTSGIIHPPILSIMTQKPQPIIFENLEISSRVKDDDVDQAVGELRKDGNDGSGRGSLATELFFDHNSNRWPLGNQTQT